MVAGEGLAALALERSGGTDFRESRWREVEFTVIYRAVFVRYLHGGLPDREAKNRALSEVKGYLGMGSSSGVRLLSARSGQSGQEANEQPGNGTVTGRVREYLAAHPAMAGQSVNHVLSDLHSAGIKAGRTTVAEVLQERKQQSSH